MLGNCKRYLPALAFLAGFTFDALTLGRRVSTTDFWALGALLASSAVLILWLGRRLHQALPPPWPEPGLRGKLRELFWLLPYPALQFVFGGMFSALFILYFKSSGHLGAWIGAAVLGALLLANEFAGRRYGQRFTLTWAVFGLNAILLANFALPWLAGSLADIWFYLATLGGALLTHALWRLAPGRPGNIAVVWMLALAMLLAGRSDLIAPVPLVKKELALGHALSQQGNQYQLWEESVPDWQFWRQHAATLHVAPGARLFGLSSVFAPRGITTPLEHRWEKQMPDGSWKLMARARFQASGGRENGFRGHSWVLAPAAGEWRLVVATQDGRTIASHRFAVIAEPADPEQLESRLY